MKPVFDDGVVTLYNARCEDVVPSLDKVSLLLTDPPYGINADNRRQSLSRGKLTTPIDYGESDWDAAPPPRWLLDMCVASADRSIVFGGNYFELPPSSCWLVWDKDNGSTDFADCELAWTNLPKAVRLFKWRWNGMLQQKGGDDKEKRYHPTQKPLALMRWAIGVASVPDDGIVLDPFAGSGTTLLAAKREGIRSIGIEANSRYCDAVISRLQQSMLF